MPEGNLITETAVDGKFTRIPVFDDNGLANQLSFFRGAIHTGVLTGGGVTVNVDPTKFDIAAGTGVIYNWSDPANPTRIYVAWPEKLACPVPNLAAGFTTVAIDPNGDPITVSGIVPSPAFKKNNINLQSVVHTNGVSITLVSGSSIPAYEVIAALFDFITQLGPINRGNKYSAAGVDLKIKKDSGTTTLPFVNRAVDPQNPSISTDAAQDPVPVLTVTYQDGVGGFVFSSSGNDIDPDQWDDGSGTLQPVANNKWTIKRLYWFAQTLSTSVLQGQTEYSSLANARDAVNTENFVVSPVFAAAKLVSALLVKKGTTDLSDVDNEFVDLT